MTHPFGNGCASEEVELSCHRAGTVFSHPGQKCYNSNLERVLF